MQIIPFKQFSAFEIQVTLTGNIYIFRFKWNALNKYWSMNIYDGNDAPLILGIKLVENYDLTSSYSVEGMPLGDILCQNILNQWGDIKRDSMGFTTELIYYEPGELSAIEAAAML